MVCLVTLKSECNGRSGAFEEVHVVSNRKITEFREFQGDEQTENRFWSLERWFHINSFDRNFRWLSRSVAISDAYGASVDADIRRRSFCLFPRLVVIAQQISKMLELS